MNSNNEVNDYIVNELRSSLQEIRSDNKSFQAEVRAELEGIKDELHAYTNLGIELHSKLPRLEQDVDKLVKTIHLGNGSPPVVVQLSAIQSTLQDMKERERQVQVVRANMMETVQSLSIQLKDKVNLASLSEQDLKRTKWTAYSKIAAAVGLAVPGILAFLSTFF